MSKIEIDVEETLPKGVSIKFIVFRLVSIACFGVLSLQLWHLQVTNGATYRAAVDRNITRIVRVDPMRGVIYDRNHHPLVQNEPSFSVGIVPANLPSDQAGAVFGRLSRLLAVPEKTLQTQYDTNKPLVGDYDIVDVADDVSYDNVLRLGEQHDSFPGVTVFEVPYRTYPMGSLYGQILGYEGKMDAQSYAALKGQGYIPTDSIGKAGLELQYESVLRGQPGSKEIEVDNNGQPMRTLAENPPQNGDSLVLTLDSDLQAETTQALQQGMAQMASWPAGIPPEAMAVVLDVHTGAVLSMVSLPNYDNNLFARGITAKNYTALLNNPGQPLINKTIGGLYPPGSTFKQITAAAGLQTGMITPDTVIVDKGYLMIGTFLAKGWTYPTGLGPLTVRRALAWSSDPFFYTVAGGQNPDTPSVTGVGPDKLAYYAEQFGLGATSGIDVPGEVAGVAPTPAWKLKTQGQPWYPGDTTFYGIGQSYVLVTPLQMANVIATVANGGTLYQPHLVKQILDSTGKVVKNVAPHVIRKVAVDPQNLAVIRDGLRGAVNYQGSTVYGVRMQDVQVAGKTGTAQVGQPNPKTGQYPATEAWFVGYAPADDPQIAVAVLVPGGGEGAYTAVPIGKEIIDYYFHDAGVQGVSVPTAP